MKKFTRTGKKVLSVFLAALMVMTAWVFVAPTKAEAVAGKYDMRVSIYVADYGDYDGGFGQTAYVEYTGTNTPTSGNIAGMTITHISNNGTGTESLTHYDLGKKNHVVTNSSGTNNPNVTKVIGPAGSGSGSNFFAASELTGIGFPKAIQFSNEAAYLDGCKFYFSKIEISPTGKNSWSVLWEGEAGSKSGGSRHVTKIELGTVSKVSGDLDYNSTTENKWNMPKPETFAWSPNTLSAMTCPKDGEATQTVKVTAKDQYGVDMYDPTWSISGSNKSTGLSMSTGSNRAESSTIKVTNSANIAGTTDSQTVTVTATWGSGQTNTRTFTLNDTTYTATFAGLKNANGTDKANVTETYEHGHTPTAAATASSYAIGDYDYTHTGWSPTIEQPITADRTYTAEYSSVFVKADLTKLQEIIAKANAIMTTELWTTGSYTVESMTNFTTALDAAVALNKDTTGRTQQSAVGSAVDSLQAAIDALALKTYTVRFYDADENVIDIQQVTAGQSATAPASPAKNDDETYHYSFKGWNQSFDDVTKDLDVLPEYTSEAHEWQTSTTVEANCQHGAGIKKTCSVCSRVSESYDDTLGAHTKSTHYAVSKEPTCTETGTGYYYCTVCGTNMGDVTIPAKGHAYDNGTVTEEATCTKTGTRVHKCKTCGDTYTETLEKIPHTYTKTSSVAATCEHSTYDVMTCSVCGDTYNKYVGSIADHTWEWTVKNATSTSNGSVTGKCTVCGYTVTKEVPFDGHHYDFDNPTVTDPTCTKAGSVVIECTDSGCTEKITIALKATGIHNYTTKYNKPSCTEAGSIVNTCSVCGTSTTVETIAALGHNYGEAVVTAATCTEDGKMTYTCSACGNVKETVIPATGHKEYIVDAIEATCNTEGRTEGKKCAVCGETIVASTVIAKKAHSFTGEVKTIAATCEADGATLTKCANCDTYKIETIAKIGHNYVSEVIAPTCTSEGYTKHTCQNCGKVYTDTKTAMIEHNYVLNNDLSLAPSCEGEGVNIFVCSVCGSSKSEKVSAKGHSFGDWSEYIPATCTNKGVSIRSCSVCGNVEMKDIPANGHAWKDDYTIDYEPTCISAGQKSIHCSVCDAIKPDSAVAIEKLGHNITTTSTEASCTEAGSIVEKCSRCDYEKTTIIQPKQHELVTTPAAGNCGNAGYTEVTCKNCDLSYKTDFVQATGNHTWTVTQTVSHDKTVVSGKCSVCGATFESEVPNGHKFTKYEVTTKATCTTEGVITVKCEDADCSESYTINIGKDANAHTKIKTTVADPTCEAEGKVTTVCEDCGTTVYPEQTIQKNNHNWKAEITKKATCMEAGVLTYTCETCGTTKTEEIPLDANAHNFVKGETLTPATCTTPAYYEYTCSNGCSESYKSFVGEANGHTWTVGSTSQSGTNLTITCKCPACGETHEETVTVAEGHNYTTVTDSTLATCKTAGSITIACDKVHDASCTAVITVETPVDNNAHTYEVKYNAPTCSAEGSVVVACKDCGEKLHDDITVAKLEHSWNDGEVTTEAKCDQNGVRTYTCSECSATKTEVIPMLGHDWTTTPEHREADCTHGEYYHYTCTRCDKTYDAVVNGAEALGHQWDNGEITKEPTCNADGEKTFTCARCGETRVETIAKLGSHSYTETYSAGDIAPTCTSDGYTAYICKYCKNTADIKYVRNVGTKLDHNTDAEWKTVKESTCTEAGYKTKTCDRCNTVIETEVLPLAKHNFTETVTKNLEKECPGASYTYNKCSVCGVVDESSIKVSEKDHEYTYVVDKQATCKEDGLIIAKCNTCENVSIEIPVSKDTVAHKYDEGVTVAPTCQKEGSVTFTCAVCGDTLTKSLDKVDHDHSVLVQSVAPTCASSGYDEYRCKNCDDVKKFITEAPLNEHNYFETDKSTAPTCTEAGHKYFECSDCKTTYDYEVPATGHKYDNGTITQSKDCTKPEITTYKCQNDGCDDSFEKITAVPNGHSFPNTWTVTKEATETEDGEQMRKCANCDETETAPIPATVHKWGAEPISKAEADCEHAETWIYRCEGCALCNDKPEAERATKTVTVGNPKGHTMTVGEIQAQTCTEDGKYLAYCTTCKKSFGEEYTVNAKGHVFKERIAYEPATCMKKGSMTYKCANCEETTTIEIPVNPDAHHMVKGAVQAATCTEAGYTTWVCDNVNEDGTTCGHSYNEFTDNPTTHNKVNGTWKVAVEATCNSKGYKYLICGNEGCDAILETEVIPATGSHNYVKHTDGTVTCTTGSYTYEKCESCGALKPDSASYSDATGHSFTKFVNKDDPTPEKPGSITYACENSGCDETITLAIPADGHTYEEDTSKYEPATCESNGKRVFVCTTHPDGSCGEAYTYEEAIPALGHINGEIEIQQATCNAAGLATVKCARDGCGKPILTKSIEKLPHVFDEAHKSVTEATCTSVGKIVYNCANGCTGEGTTLTVDIPMKQHDYSFTGHTDATCRDSGFDTYTCANCGDSYVKITEQAKGHKFVLDREVPATCTAAGHKYFVCEKGCDDENAKYDYETPMLAHNYVESTVEASCTTAGYTCLKCSDCGAIKADSVKVTGALGHDYSVKVSDTTAKCSRCDDTITVEVVKEIDGVTHTFDRVVTKQPTCKEEGEITYTCRLHDGCKENYTESIEKTAHTYSADSVVKTPAECHEDGTCTNGEIVFNCAFCNETIERIEIVASHNFTEVSSERKDCSTITVSEKCGTCGYVKTTDLTVEAKHNYDMTNPHTVVPATCENEGFTVYECKDCGVLMIGNKIPALKHSKTHTDTLEATCEADGYRRTICDYCGKVVAEETYKATGHTIETTIVKPSCDKAGSKITMCKKCGKVEKIEILDQTPHTWGEWVRNDGSCLVDGTETRTCSACGATETKHAGKAEHKFDSGVVTPPTCLTDGFTTYTCTVCGYSYAKDYVPKKGHDYSSDFTTIIEPTCHSTGARVQTCKTCGAADPDRDHYYWDIPRLEHNYGEWTVVAKPDCENNGLKTRTCLNPDCPEGYEGHTESVAIAKIGHNYGEWTVTKEATCIAEGEKQRTCDRCNHVDIVAIEKSGHKRVADFAVEATCTSTGLTAGSHCSVCGYVFVAQKETPMTNHYDLGGDGKCDTCGKLMTDSTGTDTCFCHRTGFMAIIYNLFVKVIWKIFKINQECVCGVKHY